MTNYNQLLVELRRIADRKQALLDLMTKNIQDRITLLIEHAK